MIDTNKITEALNEMLEEDDIKAIWYNIECLIKEINKPTKSIIPHVPKEERAIFIRW